MHRSIGYHTRLHSDNRVKVVGGSFGGSIDQETVERLAHLFKVVIKPSGTAVFVDKEGREVALYLSVDPASTAIGREAIKQHQKQGQVLANSHSAKQQEIKEKALSKLSAEERDALGF